MVCRTKVVNRCAGLREAMQVWLFAGGLAVALIGAIWDVATYRIPNKLTYSAMALAILVHPAVEGWIGVPKACGGLLIGGAIYLVLYLLRTMGAGDVKLMAAVGAWVGTGFVVQLALYSAIAGGVCALAMVLFKGRLRQTIGNIGDLLRFHSAMGAEVHPTLNLENPEAQRFPYGVAIFAGMLVLLVSQVR